MLDHLRPSGAVLAALAAWSLALLGLAFAGLGARFSPHPDDPSLAPPLPEVRLAEGGTRLGPLSQYAEVGARPLLSLDRRPSAIADAGDSEAPLEFELSGVLLVGDFRAATLQPPGGGRGQRVKLGELVEGTAWRLVQLEPRSAVFEGPQGRRELELRRYDGSADPRPAAPAVPATAGTAPVAATSRRPASGTEAPRQAPAAPGNAPAEPANTAEMTQEQQVEAIRRRIEARRAQMREDAARRNGQKVE